MSVGDPFDDQHGAGAGGATQQVGCFGAIWARSSAEQLAAACEGALPASVGKEAEVADADFHVYLDVRLDNSRCVITYL